MKLKTIFRKKETNMTTPDYSHQAIISGLRAEIDGKDKIIAEHQKQIQQLMDTAQRNYALYSSLQDSVKDFFEARRNDDNFEFDIDEVNTFFAENSIDPLKREYRVEFRIEGTVLVEAENEDEARDIVDELDVVHWSSEIENFEAEATNVEATF
jgi:hypothetical protein